MAPASTSPARGATASSSTCDGESRANERGVFIVIAVDRHLSSWPRSSSWAPCVAGIGCGGRQPARAETRDSATRSARKDIEVEAERRHGQSVARSSVGRGRSLAAAPTSSRPAPPPRPCGSRRTPRPTTSPGVSSSTGRSSPSWACPSPPSAAAVHRLPVADRLRRLRLARSASARSATSRPTSRRATASSTSPRAACGSPSTRPPRCPRPSIAYKGPACLPGMEAGIVALYQKCPHLGCRVPDCLTLAVVRVPVPRLAVQPGRREEGRPGSSWHGPLRRRRSTATASVIVEHRRQDHPGPAHRHQHHRPGGRGPALRRCGHGWSQRLIYGPHRTSSQHFSSRPLRRHQWTARPPPGRRTGTR